MTGASAGLDFQRTFAAALVADVATATATATTTATTTTGDPAIDRLVVQPGFAVYRNTVLAGWLDALVANHPTLHALVGDAWFRGAAREFLRRHPPRDAVLARIGDGFPAFAGALPSARETPYLADVGRLDRLWTESHLAPDAPVLAGADLATLDPVALATLRLRPHPAVRWTSLDAPAAFSIWQRHRERLALDAPLPAEREAVCLVRPRGPVEWLRTDAVGIAFLDACAAGRALDDALQRAAVASEAAGEVADAEAATWFAQLVRAGAFTPTTDDAPETRP